MRMKDINRSSIKFKSPPRLLGCELSPVVTVISILISFNSLNKIFTRLRTKII